MPQVLIENATVSVAPPPSRWKSFYFKVPNFKDLTTTRDHYIETPEFSCNGRRWYLVIYPGGRGGADEGMVSIFLHHRSEGSITASFELMLIDKFGNKKNGIQTTQTFHGMRRFWGWGNFMKRSAILDESKNILDNDGTLTVSVSIKEDPSDVYVPKNPLLNMMQGIFLDETTADVCFEVSSAEATGEQKKAKASVLFHAHSQILKACAPMLANLFDLDDSDGKLTTATITDIKPDVFRHLLYYVYGGNVAKEDLKTHAKDIIDAADKYSIVNMKLEAEAAFVKSIKITMDTAMDNLLYADAKNCALLKETVMDFLAENSTEAIEKISFKDVPGHVVKDLLVVISRNGKKEASDTAAADELTTLRVSDLRRKLAEKGLNVDGSREAMIESIKNSATESSDVNNDGGGENGDDDARDDEDD